MDDTRRRALIKGYRQEGQGRVVVQAISLLPRTQGRALMESLVVKPDGKVDKRGVREGRMTTTTQHWTSEPLDAAGEAVAAWVAARLCEADPPLPTGPAVALHVATPDNGSREALAFWRAAQTTGYALAAPGAFPWTLSNSVTGRVSLALGVTGPCTTWVGGPEAVAEAELAARLDLDDGLVEEAIVVAVAGVETPDAVGSPVRVALSVWVLDREALPDSNVGDDRRLGGDLHPRSRVRGPVRGR